jgi:hypothetical protein
MKLYRAALDFFLNSAASLATALSFLPQDLKKASDNNAWASA